MQRDADGIAALDPAPEHRFPAKRVRRWNTSLKARASTKQAIYQLPCR